MNQFVQEDVKEAIYIQIDPAVIPPSTSSSPPGARSSTVAPVPAPAATVIPAAISSVFSAIKLAAPGVRQALPLIPIDPTMTYALAFQKYPNTCTPQCPFVDIYSLFGNWSASAGVIVAPVISPADTWLL